MDGCLFVQLGRGTVQIPETVGLGIAQELDLIDGSGSAVGKVFVQISLPSQAGSILAVRKNTPTEVQSPFTSFSLLCECDQISGDVS